MGLKGRFEEEKIDDDHELSKLEYPVLRARGRRSSTEHENALMALNERLRDDYIKDCQAGVDRWNKILAKAGVSFAPHAPAQGLPPQDRQLSRETHVSPRAAC
jgi:benzoyl-CoA 2,3-dioxygenase component B